MRASDQEREQTAQRLRTAAGEGRLDVDELDERLQQALTAKTRQELATLTEDVPDETQGPANVAVTQQQGTSKIIAVMSGADRKGDWTLAPKVSVAAFMGGADLDLHGAKFAAETVEMTVTAIMGGVDIRVPEGLNVEISDFNLMGGTTIKLGDSRTPTPGGPTLKIKVFTFWGGVDVKRGPKLSRKQRKAHQLHP